LEGLAQYTGGPGEAVATRIPDLDGDGQQDLLVAGKGYTSATGNVATAVFLSRGKCGRFVGAFWARGGTDVRHVAGKHSGLPVLQVGTHMTFKEFQTRYCFDGKAYVSMAQRVRHFYDHKKHTLRHVPKESHWEAWKVSADDQCRPLKTNAGPAKKVSATGGKVRRAVLQTLGKVLEQELSQKVKIRVTRRNLKLAGGWAVVHGTPVKPDGSPVDYSITSYQADIDDGTFDERVSALLRLDRGKWTVVVHEIGCTDLCWEGWDKKHRAPAALFKD